MMIEKWYSAYQEALHVPVVVRFPATTGGDGRSEPAQLDILSSHIDILPTVLGFAGVDAAERRSIGAELAMSRPVPPLPGVDLSAIIESALTDERAAVPVIEPDGEVREGVLFITDDEITAPLPPSRNAQDRRSWEEFEVYRKVVEAVREGRGKGPVALAPGAVKQPNHVRCVRTRDWKLARYFDPSGQAPQEWEMYDLKSDPNEAVNLVQVAVSPPSARPDLPDSARVQAAADRLAALLARLERRDL